MNKNLFRILAFISALLVLLISCGLVGSATPTTEPLPATQIPVTEAPVVEDMSEPTETEYVLVSAGRPRTLEGLIVNGQQLSHLCPNWVLQNGTDLTFAPGKDIKSKNYFCETNDGTKKLIIEVHQYEQVKAINLKQEITITAGEEIPFFIFASQIPFDHISSRFTNTTDWMWCKDDGCNRGFLIMNPPLEAAGQTFTIYCYTEDYVWGGSNEIIQINVKVE